MLGCWLKKLLAHGIVRREIAKRPKELYSVRNFILHNGENGRSRRLCNQSRQIRLSQRTSDKLGKRTEIISSIKLFYDLSFNRSIRSFIPNQGPQRNPRPSLPGDQSDNLWILHVITVLKNFHLPQTYPITFVIQSWLNSQNNSHYIAVTTSREGPLSLSFIHTSISYTYRRRSEIWILPKERLCGEYFFSFEVKNNEQGLKNRNKTAETPEKSVRRHQGSGSKPCRLAFPLYYRHARTLLPLKRILARVE